MKELDGVVFKDDQLVIDTENIYKIRFKRGDLYVPGVGRVEDTNMIDIYVYYDSYLDLNQRISRNEVRNRRDQLNAMYTQNPKPKDDDDSNLFEYEEDEYVTVDTKYLATRIGVSSRYYIFRLRSLDNDVFKKELEGLRNINDAFGLFDEKDEKQVKYSKYDYTQYEFVKI